MYPLSNCIPSTSSSCVDVPFDSSTVITPSLPTLSIASAISSPIAEAMDKVGKDGVITVEESKGTATQLELVEGMQFDKGYVSAYMVTDPERMEAVLEDPLILLHEKKISSVQDMLPMLEKILRLGRPLLVIAEDVEG